MVRIPYDEKLVTDDWSTVIEYFNLREEFKAVTGDDYTPDHDCKEHGPGSGIINAILEESDNHYISTIVSAQQTHYVILQLNKTSSG